MGLLGWNVTEFGPLWPDFARGKWLGLRAWSQRPGKEQLLHARRRLAGRFSAFAFSVGLFLEFSSWPDGQNWPRRGEAAEGLKRAVLRR